MLASRETAADADATVGRLRGVAYGVVAAIFLGLLVTFLAEAGKESAPWAVFTLRLVSVPIFLIALLVTRAWRGKHPTRRETGTMVGVGLLDNLANLTFALAGQTGLLALISVVGCALSGRDGAARVDVPARTAHVVPMGRDRDGVRGRGLDRRRLTGGGADRLRPPPS